MNPRVILTALTLTFTIGSAVPNAHAAGTDLSKFESRVGKSASSVFDSTPNVVCVCREATSHNGHAGFLRQTRLVSGPGGQIKVHIDCAIVNFFQDSGEVSGIGGCDIFDILPK